MKKYLCIVESDNTSERVYQCDTSSAKKAAAEYGIADSGESVTIRNRHSGRIVSRAVWNAEKRDYISVSF